MHARNEGAPGRQFVASRHTHGCASFLGLGHHHSFAFLSHTRVMYRSAIASPIFQYDSTFHLCYEEFQQI
jgi:hypothetical protein